MRRSWILEGSLAVLLAVAASGCAADADDSVSEDGAGDSSDELKLGKRYLALGDSVAFGFNPVDGAVVPAKIGRFKGYPEVVGLAPIPTANASCVGETSGSFLSPSAPDNGCRAWKGAGNPLHVNYAGAQTQMQYALSYLAANKATTATVSIGIGANDLFLLQDGCTASAPTPAAIGACIQASGGTKSVAQCATEVVSACIAQGAPATIGRAAQNIGTIVGGIRQTGYTGQIALVTYYALQYADPSDLLFQAIVGLDQATVQVAKATGVHVAKGFSAFAAASKRKGGDPCAAGLLYKMSDGTCNKHPSALGHTVLAAAVAAAVPASSIDLAAATPRF